MPLLMYAAAASVVLQVANTLATEVLTAPGQEVAVVATNQVRLPQLRLGHSCCLMPCRSQRGCGGRSHQPVSAVCLRQRCLQAVCKSITQGATATPVGHVLSVLTWQLCCCAAAAGAQRPQLLRV
jgi:hypothetical protein